MTKDFNVSVSMNQAAPVKTGVVLKQGDFGFDLKITVQDFVVTGTTPQIVFRKPMGAVESTDVTASGNVYTYTFKGTELDTPGKVFCDLKLKNSTTQRISSASFQFECIADTLDGLAEESSSYSDTIAQLMDNCILKSETAGLVKNDGSIDTRIESAVSENATQISNLKSDLIGVKYYGELSALGAANKIMIFAQSGDTLRIETKDGSNFTVGRLNVNSQSMTNITTIPLPSGSNYKEYAYTSATPCWYIFEDNGTAQDIIIKNITATSNLLYPTHNSLVGTVSSLSSSVSTNTLNISKNKNSINQLSTAKYIADLLDIGIANTQIFFAEKNDDIYIATKNGTNFTIGRLIVYDISMTSITTIPLPGSSNYKEYTFTSDTPCYFILEDNGTAQDIIVKNVTKINNMVSPSYDDLVGTVSSLSSAVSTNTTNIGKNKDSIDQLSTIKYTASLSALGLTDKQIFYAEKDDVIYITTKSGSNFTAGRINVHDKNMTNITTIPLPSGSNYKDYTFTSDTPCYFVFEDTGTAQDIIIINRTKNSNVSTIVTQTNIIESVQKQVIETEVDIVQSARDASQGGFLPSNTGKENYEALQALLDDGGVIYVSVPGTYDIAYCLEIGSNTSLLCNEGVYFRRVTNPDTTHDHRGLLYNKAAQKTDGTYDSNIVIDGLNVIVNNITATGHLIDGMRSHIGMRHAKYIRFTNVTCTDIYGQAFFSQWSECENVIIDNLHAEGDKDAIHVSGGCKNFHISNCKFMTNDDCVGLNAYDYYTSSPEWGDIENVVIKNCFDMANPNQTGGLFVRMLSGSWNAWESGHAYYNGESVVSDGKVYVLCMSSAGPHTSTDQPVHSSYYHTYSDGCQWRFVHNGAMYHCECKNITVRSCTLLKDRGTAMSFRYEQGGQYCVSYSAGSYAEPQHNVLLDDIRCVGDIGVLMGMMTPIDSLKIINSDIKCDTIVDASTIAEESGNNYETSVKLLNNNYNMSSSDYAIKVAGARHITAKMNDSTVLGAFTAATSGNVTLTKDF